MALDSSSKSPSALKFFLLALLVIVIDQASKWSVHTYMFLQHREVIPIFGKWAELNYTTNPGMAFGVELPAPYGKLLLTGFRLLAVCGIGYYIVKLCRERAHKGFLAAMSLILGGAIGNLIDSIFYGVIYENAPLGSPSRWFYGQVIDMLRVPIYQGYFPQSWPIIGGQYTSGFPIFNIADSSIFIGVVLILLNQSRFFRHEDDKTILPGIKAEPAPERVGEEPAVPLTPPGPLA